MRPYVWAAVAVAHTAIGIALWTLFQPLGSWQAVGAAAALHAAFEIVQGRIAGKMLWWDSVLDWTAVTLGTVTACRLWEQDRTWALMAILACAAISLIGAGVRREKQP